MGGGFCKIHGPFDPPHRVCPYCAEEASQRQAFGPPVSAAAETLDEASPPDEAEFVRQTVEPDQPGQAKQPPVDVTEMMDRPGAPQVGVYQSVDLRPPLGWLIVKMPLDQRGTVYPVRANQVIGRMGDIRWEDPRLSRQHARLTFEPPRDADSGDADYDVMETDADVGGSVEAAEMDGMFHIWPFGPTNPVYINDQEIRGATPLYENDLVRLGDTLLVFKVLID
ncbi:MAG: FHA domain-containing protein [Anaerolineae bacterium]|nr:FHA domain-containing protein [Anaerolineae bacterium]